MKYSYLILLGIFVMTFVFADSTTETKFNIVGCNFEFEGEDVGVAAGECSGGSASGYFFCGTDATSWETTKDGLGCSMGNENYELGDNFCCPAGMFCNKTISGGFKCERRLENCFNQKDKDECEKNGCLWMNVTNECSDGTRDYDCSYYKDEDSCNTDIWNLGKSGIGAELCGTTVECGDKGNKKTFSIPDSSCGCVWYPLAGCQFKMVGAQMFYGGEQDKFSCSNVYSFGECLGGSQEINWTSNAKVISGFSPNGTIPKDCLEIFKCEGGKGTRLCGEPIVKLPGFSLFSLVFSLIIIGLFFVFKRK